MRDTIAHLRLLCDPADVEAFEAASKACRGLGSATTGLIVGHAKESACSVMAALAQLARNNLPQRAGTAKVGQTGVRAAQQLWRSHEKLHSLLLIPRITLEDVVVEAVHIQRNAAD